jgi:acyl-CoA thioester hydrolase
MARTFAVRVEVRSDEVDANGHLNHAVYPRYGAHARTAHLRTAGCPPDALAARGLALVLLDTRVRFLAELRTADQVEITSELAFGEGRSFVFTHELRRAGETIAEITATSGLLDTRRRRLVAGPADLLADIATNPGLLGVTRVLYGDQRDRRANDRSIRRGRVAPGASSRMPYGSPPSSRRSPSGA